MRFDFRLHGTTDDGKGKPCIMEGTVYLSIGQDIVECIEAVAKEGPWYYKENNELVPEGQIVVNDAQRLINGKWE